MTFSLILSVPAIIIFLPITLITLPNFFKKFIRSKTSGSIAQFDRVVIPFALKAASKAFSVAPTEMDGNLILQPVKPFLA